MKNTAARECTFFCFYFVFGVQSRRRWWAWVIRRRNAKRRPTTKRVWTSTKQWTRSAAGRWLTSYRTCSPVVGCTLRFAAPLLTSTSPRGTSSARLSEHTFSAWTHSSTSGSARTTNNQHKTYCRSLQRSSTVCLNTFPITSFIVDYRLPFGSPSRLCRTICRISWIPNAELLVLSCYSAVHGLIGLTRLFVSFCLHVDITSGAVIIIIIIITDLYSAFRSEDTEVLIQCN